MMRIIELEELTEQDIDAALAEIKKRAMEKIQTSNSGKYPFTSIPEAAGKLTEEYHEVLVEAHLKDKDKFLSEIKDVAFICIRALSSNKVKKIDQ